MKIRKIELRNNEILGNIEFDFTDEKGKVIDTIIFAGENGAGKTAVLDIIYQFTNYSLEEIKRDEKRIFEIELEEAEINKLLNNDSIKHLFNERIVSNIFKVYFDYSITKNWDQVKIKIDTISTGGKTIDGVVFPNEPTVLKSLYSIAEINYTPDEIKNVTSKDVDDSVTKSEKASKNLATEITQLLIDIRSLDSQDFANWGKDNIGNPVVESKLDNRIKRFTTAFDFMFPTKQFDRIVNKKSLKSIIFKENGNEMPIENLSSGEKQIVFRGSFLLKDKKSNKGALILIDEPEISLHPSWQQKILDYYKMLFTENGVQNSQMIVATHSPFIIHNKNRSKDKVIVLKKDESNRIIISNVPKFQNWTEEELVKEAFNIDYFKELNKNIVLLEGETDEMYFNKTLEIFKKQKIDLEFNWVGRINDAGKVEFSGDSALNQTKNFLVSNNSFLKNRVILLYDTDTNKPSEDIGKLKIRKMSQNATNLIYKKGVENLLNLPEDFIKENFYESSTKTDDYGADSLIKVFNKKKLCNWICNELTTENQKHILSNIDLEINKLIE